MHSSKLARVKIAMVVALWLPSIVVAQSLELSWSTIDGGGGWGIGESYELEGTIGQPDAIAMVGGEFELVGGFWAFATGGTSIPGDCDGDGDVNLEDYADIEACLTGPGNERDAGCGCFDLDQDGDIDLADFAEFQIVFIE